MPNTASQPGKGFCFVDSFWARPETRPVQKQGLSYDNYNSNAVAHFRGVRHHPHSYDNTECPKILFEPFASSIRKAALESGAYELMTSKQLSVV